jgi:hypothetical protein
MPLPTRQELEAMNSIEPQLSPDVLELRTDYFGPITRICLASTVEEYDKFKSALKQKLHSFRYKEVSQMIRAATVPTTQAHGLSWWIIHLDATETLKDPIIYWSSAQIFDQVTSIADEESLAELEDVIADRLRTPSPLIPPPRLEYQKWATYKLALGMDLHVRYYTADGNLEQTESLVHLAETKALPFYTYTFSLEVLKSNQGKILHSTNPKSVLCDAAVIVEDTLILIQATTGIDHNLNVDAFKEYAEEAERNKLKKMTLVFVVPAYGGFKVKPKDLNQALEFIKIERNFEIKIAVATLVPQSVRPNSLLVKE